MQSSAGRRTSSSALRPGPIKPRAPMRHPRPRPRSSRVSGPRAFRSGVSLVRLCSPRSRPRPNGLGRLPSRRSGQRRATSTPMTFPTASGRRWRRSASVKSASGIRGIRSLRLVLCPSLCLDGALRRDGGQRPDLPTTSLACPSFHLPSSSPFSLISTRFLCLFGPC